MLQVARLAPTQLGESRDLVAGFLREQLNPDGGFQDRSGTSDLYYTVFGLDALIALQEDPPVEQTAAYLDGFGDGAGLDFVHLACLARGWAALRRVAGPPIVDHVLARIESFSQRRRRLRDDAGAQHGSCLRRVSRARRVSGPRTRTARPGPRARVAAEACARRTAVTAIIPACRQG